jgi:hypothetical protein
METITVETLDDLPADAELGQVVERTGEYGSSFLRRSDAGRPWRRVTVEHASSYQAAYADSRYEYVVTFEGETPSSKPGWALPFATHPPRSKREDEHVVWSTHTPEQKDRMHDDRIKEIIKTVARPWRTDSTVGEDRVMGGAWLERFECLDRQPFLTTYRVVVVEPNMS